MAEFLDTASFPPDVEIAWDDPLLAPLREIIRAARVPVLENDFSLTPHPHDGLAKAPLWGRKGSSFNAWMVEP